MVLPSNYIQLEYYTTELKKLNEKLISMVHYCNFHWVLFSWLTWQSQNFSTHENYISPWWWAWPQTSWQRGQHFPVLASNSSHCHPADSIFDTNILLSHTICPSLCRYCLVLRLRARSNMHINYIITLQCHAPAPSPGLVAVKTTKINLESLIWLSTKITRHTTPTSGISHYIILALRLCMLVI